MNSDIRVQQGLGDLLTINECSALTRLRPSTLRDWILKKRLTYVKLGWRVFIRRSDIDALILAGVVTATNVGIRVEE